jgi:PPM family protein phosphatase
VRPQVRLFVSTEKVRSCIEEDDPEDTWPHGWTKPGTRDEARLHSGLRRANRAIHGAGTTRPDARGMATTFAGLLLSHDAATIAHAGDSRVYRYRRGRLERLTDDPTLLEEMLLRGGVSLDEIESLAGRNMAHAVTRALGCDASIQIDTRAFPLLPGDVFLLCSDGLWGPVPERDIASILAWSSSLPAQVAGLIGRALELGGPDNITCVLARAERAEPCR